MISLKSTLSSLLLCAAVAACGGSDTFVPREVLATRMQAFWPATNLQQKYTVRSDDEWQRVWLAHEPQTFPKTEQPRVDFSRKMIVGLTEGVGSNGCYGMSIRRVIEEEDQLRVEYISIVPPPFTICTQAIVALTDFVIVDRFDKRVVFVQAGV